MTITEIYFKTYGANLLLKIERRSGSIKHYYHFILDLVWPCFQALQSRGISPVDLTHVCTSDDETINFKGHFREIFGIELSLNTTKILLAHLNPAVRTVRLAGFNSKRQEYYEEFENREALMASSSSLKVYLKDRFALANNTDQAFRIVLIERSKQVAEGGSSRRHISNQSELNEKVLNFGEAIGVEVEIVELADLDFPQQFALFNQSNSIIIAQHGAGLVNTIWAGEGMCVCEIEHLGRKHFANLCKDLGIEYHLLGNEFIKESRDEIVSVDATAIVDFLKTSLLKKIAH